MKVKTLSLTSVRSVDLTRSSTPETPRLRGRGRIERNRMMAFKKPLCVMCEAKGKVSAAEEWDHIVPLWQGGADAPSNLQGLCHAHHAEKTAAETAARHGKAAPK